LGEVIEVYGYVDLAAPFYPTEYTFGHLAPDKNKANIQLKYYLAACMLY
jgi:hypothetical protein